MDDAVSKGATVTVGGMRNKDHPDGLFYLPTVSSQRRLLLHIPAFLFSMLPAAIVNCDGGECSIEEMMTTTCSAVTGPEVQ